MESKPFNAKGLLELWVEIIEADADLTEKVARAEELTGIRFKPDMLTKPEDMVALAANSSTEDLGAYLKFTFELSPFTPKIGTMMTIPPQEKKQLAADLRKLAQKYRTRK